MICGSCADRDHEECRAYYFGHKSWCDCQHIPSKETVLRELASTSLNKRAIKLLNERMAVSDAETRVHT